MRKNLKVSLGISYLILLFAFLYFIFTGIEISKLDEFSYYKEIQKELIAGNLRVKFIIFLFD